ncbi:hypothetical protein PACTADRAFT_32965 [Pachysolen tannophilus NRRL Y-2460]|uniref:Uncharacterized protein n=1 Tax=Pachysolen tannophilus NRRL Y-2460 TaxID=669874 RepID=A0A1E4TVJ5_PACTA|nr:hypothetical protein PACTADRAFT_32965 [Pachysolen tannophilus NRRL Y-2460]
MELSNLISKNSEDNNVGESSGGDRTVSPPPVETQQVNSATTVDQLESASTTPVPQQLTTSTIEIGLQPDSISAGGQRHQVTSNTGSNNGGNHSFNNNINNNTTKQHRGSTPTAKAATLEIPKGLNKADIVGGSMLRRYFNENVTLHLKDGLAELGRVKPEHPLQWLGEWLITKGKEEEELKKKQENHQQTQDQAIKAEDEEGNVKMEDS